MTIGPDPDPNTTDPNRVVDLINELENELEPSQTEPTDPIITPTATQILSINATVFSKGGRNSVSFRAPGQAIFNSPDGALVLTDLRQAVFDQFTIGLVYNIVINTTP